MASFGSVAKQSQDVNQGRQLAAPKKEDVTLSFDRPVAQAVDKS